MKLKFAILASLLALCIQCNAQQDDYGFGVFPRVTQAGTYARFFPLTGRDYARNAFLPVVSGSDTIVYFCDAYGRFLTIKPKPGGNGIYGGSGTVPSNVLATVTDRIRFLGADDFGTDYPFKIQSDGNEPGILSLKANNDSLTFTRSDVEFLIDGGPGIVLNSSRGNTDMSAEGGFTTLGLAGGDSLKVYTNGSLAITVDNAGRVGVGTDNPTSVFGVETPASTDGLKIEYTPFAGQTQSPLKVVSSNGGFSALELGASATWTEGMLTLSAPSTQGAGSAFKLKSNVGAATREGEMGLDGSGNLIFRASNASMYFDSPGSGTTYFRQSGFTQSMVIDNTGVFIGTGATASQKLDVDGNVRTRRLQIADFATITGTGGAVALSTTVTDNLYAPGADQVNLTLVLPPSPVDGQLCRVTFYNEVTGSLTLDFGVSGDFGGFPADATVGASMMFKFYSGFGWTLVTNK